MSEKIKPSFTVDGKKYEFIYTRALQVEYQKMVDEKKQDAEYQRDIAEFERLQHEYEKVHASYEKIQSAYFENPLDKDIKEAYLELKAADKQAFDEFNEFGVTHKAAGEANDYTLYMLGKLVLLALQEQHKLDEKQAESVWDKFVEENGEMGSMEFLAYVGKAFFTDIDEDTENPFIRAMRSKTEIESNRKAGLNKINK